MLTNNEPEQGPVECRICHSKTTRDLILSPCLCKGSMAYVHFRCLERWLNYSSRDTCELCSYKFNVVLNRRYSCLQSVRVWMRHPTNRAFILCDLIIGLILTTLTLSLILVCFVGLSHFVKEGYNQGIQGFWSEGIIDFFLIILLAGYLATMYSMARDHIRPWYMWWTHCNNVRLVLDKNTIVTPPVQESSESVVIKNEKSMRNKPEKHCSENYENPFVGKEVEVCNVIHESSNEEQLITNGCNATIITLLQDDSNSELVRPSISEDVAKIHSLKERAV